MGIRFKLGNGNGKEWELTGREWECRNPFAIISSVQPCWSHAVDQRCRGCCCCMHKVAGKPSVRSLSAGLRWNSCTARYLGLLLPTTITRCFVHRLWCSKGRFVYGTRRGVGGGGATTMPGSGENAEFTSFWIVALERTNTEPSTILLLPKFRSSSKYRWDTFLH